MDVYKPLKQYSQTQLRACQLKQLAILEVIDGICRQHHIDYWVDAGTLLGAVRHGGFIPWDDDIDIAMDVADLPRFERCAMADLPNGLVLQSPHTDPDAKEPIIKIRDLNSIYIEPGDDFIGQSAKGIFVDIFPFERYPDLSAPRLHNWAKGISKSTSILHHLHRYSMRSLAEWLWFGSKLLCLRALMATAKCCLPCHRYANSPTVNGYGISHLYTDVFPLSTIEFEGKRFPAPHDVDRYLQNIYGDYMQIPPIEKRKVHAVYIQAQLCPDNNDFGMTSQTSQPSTSPQV